MIGILGYWGGEDGHGGVIRTVRMLSHDPGAKEFSSDKILVFREGFLFGVL